MELLKVKILKYMSFFYRQVNEKTQNDIGEKE